jgi:hypothetical protein
MSIVIIFGTRKRRLDLTPRKEPTEAKGREVEWAPESIWTSRKVFCPLWHLEATIIRGKQGSVVD